MPLTPPLRVLCAALLGFPALGAAQPSAPGADPGDGVRSRVTMQYYDLVGRSEGDLLQAMARQGPSHNGRRFFGLTTSEVRFTYWRTPMSRGGCRLERVEVTLDVTITLPRWRPPAGTPYALERDWRHFERALRGHEDFHRRLAEEEAGVLQNALLNLRAPCNALDGAARRQAESLRARYVAHHLDYDRQTDHGRTQGAAWPRE